MAIIVPDTFDHKLAYELAQGFEPAEKLYPRYGLSKVEWDQLRRSKEFRVLVETYLAAMTKDGTTFRNKAGVLAEELLYVAHSVAVNTENSADTRMEAVKWLAKVSGKDESANKTPASNAPPFMISINLGEQKPQMTFLPPTQTVENDE